MAQLKEFPAVEDQKLQGGESGCSYPLDVTYDASAFISADGGTGKGAQLRTLLGGYRSTFIGLAPRSHGEMPPANADIRLVQGGIPRYLIWQQTALPRMLAKMQPEIFLAPYNTAPWRIPRKTKLISVVHDLILLEGASDATLQKRIIDRYRAMLLRDTIQRSAIVLTVSEFTAAHIRRLYPRVRPRVIHCAVKPSWYVREQAFSQSQRAPYILLVTNFRAHKNAPRAMEAYARYRALDRETPLQLRMVGVFHEPHAVKATMRQLGLPEDSVVVEPFLSESELQALYRHAVCAMIPSLKEGFGIPVLEAMASGTPLLSSNTWSLPEVGGDAPVYFNPLDVEEMTQALFRVARDPLLRARLTERGLMRAEVFHPDRIQAQVRAFWAELPELYRSWNS